MISLKELSKMLELEGIAHQNMMNGNRAGLEIGDKEMRPVIYADRFDELPFFYLLTWGLRPLHGPLSQLVRESGS